VADRGWRPPDSAREVFGVLAEHGALDAQLASRLARAVSLRNILVHVYVAVDLERLSGVIRNDLGDLRAFAAEAARWLEESP
jgi:uncharacterized protein YutE (UPF0331/DUF86 family)